MRGRISAPFFCDPPEQCRSFAVKRYSPADWLTQSGYSNKNGSQVCFLLVDEISDFVTRILRRTISMEMPKNNLKSALGAGQTQIGLWSSLCSATSAEIISGSGFDWILLDMEHAPNEVPTILSQLQATAASGTSIVVRAPWNDTVMIKRVLDIGARSILLPYIQTADEARQAIQSIRYPKSGVRGVAGITRASGYGRIKNYPSLASDEICVLLQVETIEAIEQLEEIAAVDGIDGIFVGPADLAASMGHLGDLEHEEVQAVIKSTAQTLAKIDIPSGILATVEEVAHRYINWGYKFVAVGTDTGLLVKASDGLAKRFKD
jgi:4-hydroxy-2-oxoheptanedioate aldolase